MSNKLWRGFAGKTASSLLAAAALLGIAGLGAAKAEETFKVGVVTFLSGGAAESFGVPAWNGGKLMIDMLNKGGVLPAPYDKKGFGGMTIEAIPVDEAGGATKQVQEFRNLVQRENVDAVLGYVSSGDVEHAKAVARRMRAGQIAINYVAGTTSTPFGGYKQSGNGREKGKWGLREFLELKAITGSMAG